MKINHLIILSVLSFMKLEPFNLNGNLIAAENKGRMIMDKIDKSNRGFVSDESKVNLILKNSTGETTVREMMIFSEEDKNGNHKALMEFIRPHDVKGARLLTHPYQDKNNEQWLFLPKIARVKKILSSEQSGPFMSSEFSYEDISGQQIDKYQYKFLEEKKVGDDVHYKIEEIPLKDSGYSKIHVWVSEKFQNVFQMDYFDRKGSPLKIFSVDFNDYEKFTVNKHSFYRAKKIVMKNSQNRKESVMEFTNRNFGLKIDTKKVSFDPLKLNR